MNLAKRITSQKTYGQIILTRATLVYYAGVFVDFVYVFDTFINENSRQTKQAYHNKHQDFHCSSVDIMIVHQIQISLLPQKLLVELALIM